MSGIGSGRGRPRRFKSRADTALRRTLLLPWLVFEGLNPLAGGRRRLEPACAGEDEAKSRVGSSLVLEGGYAGFEPPDDAVYLCGGAIE